MIARATTGRHIDRLLVGLTSGAAGAGGETRQIEWVEDLTGGETDAEMAAARIRGIMAEADSLKHRVSVKRGGRKLQRPGLHVELCWALEDRPSGDHAMEARRARLSGLETERALHGAGRATRRRAPGGARRRVPGEHGRRKAPLPFYPNRRLSAWALACENRTAADTRAAARGDSRGAQTPLGRNKRHPGVRGRARSVP